MLCSLRIVSPLLIVVMDAGGLVSIMDMDAGGPACTMVLTEPSLETLFARVSPVLLT